MSTNSRNVPLKTTANPYLVALSTEQPLQQHDEMAIMIVEAWLDSKKTRTLHSSLRNLQEAIDYMPCTTEFTKKIQSITLHFITVHLVWPEQDMTKDLKKRIENDLRQALSSVHRF